MTGTTRRLLTETEVKHYCRPDVYKRMVEDGMFDVTPLPPPISTKKTRVFDKEDIDQLINRIKGIKDPQTDEEELIARARNGRSQGKASSHRQTL
jgi:hypothetical protein